GGARSSPIDLICLVAARRPPGSRAARDGFFTTSQAKKTDRSIGALGARWGLQSENALRDALAGILEEHFGVQVVRVTDIDDEGEVFGRPDPVERVLIIQNGLLLICELKSSIDKAGLYSFERKARFYEKRHGRQANRPLVISPMVDARARKVAERLGTEVYGDAVEVEAL
ncbi:MAG: PD-(D/E)XK nuclease family protein, partial [Gammaproteobacteria bacterium]